ncbi:MAG: glycosyltransferase [Acidobacteriota bacterium]
MLTSFLAAMGVDVGQELVPADPNNRKGYFEDGRFLALNRQLLAGGCSADDGGHPDWGWTENETFDRGALEGAREAGRQLLERIGPRSGVWAFKDPRSSLLLDYWDGLLGKDARFLLVYRYPWDVADSMQRLGADVFLRRPDYAPRIWSYYNRHLLDFYRRHPERCVLASTHTVLEGPGAFARLLADKLDLDLEPAALDSVYECEMLAGLDLEDPYLRLFRASSPETIELLEQLEEAADLPTDGSWASEERAGGPLRPLRPGPEAGDEEPAISVVIPCKNHGFMLAEAIASVERSIEQPHELIVIDDGSDDERTLATLERLRAGGYRVESQEPQGLSAARNHGFRLASSPYVIPLDADNRLRPGPFLARAIAALESDSKIGAVYGDRQEFGLRSGRFIARDFDLEKILRGNYIDACAVVRREMWSDIGGYDPSLRAWEDWELWIRASCRGWELRRLDELAFDYRVRPGSMVTQTEDPEILADILDRVVKRHRHEFESLVTRQLGSALSSWLFWLQERVRAREDGAEARPAVELPELPPLASGPQHGQLQLARARLDALEARRVADRATYRLEHALAAADRYRESADQLTALLTARNESVSLLQSSVAEHKSRAADLDDALQQKLADIEALSERNEMVAGRYDETMAELKKTEKRLEAAHEHLASTEAALREASLVAGASPVRRLWWRFSGLLRR